MSLRPKRSGPGQAPGGWAGPARPAGGPLCLPDPARLHRAPLPPPLPCACPSVQACPPEPLGPQHRAEQGQCLPGCGWGWQQRQGPLCTHQYTLPVGPQGCPPGTAQTPMCILWPELTTQTGPLRGKLAGGRAPGVPVPPWLRPGPLDDAHSTAGLRLVCSFRSALFQDEHACLYRREGWAASTRHRGGAMPASHRRRACRIYPGPSPPAPAQRAAGRERGRESALPGPCSMGDSSQTHWAGLPLQQRSGAGSPPGRAVSLGSGVLGQQTPSHPL